MLKRYSSNSKVEEFINNNNIPLIEKMFSIVPAIREGYDVNKRELKIQERLAKNFYNKRMNIVGSIVNNQYEDKREVLVSSLVNQGFAPRTLDPWIDYVLLLSDRYGGWDIFLRELSYAYKFEKESSLRLKLNLLLGFIFTFPITFLIKILSYHVDPIVTYSLWLINISIFIAWVIFYVGSMKKEMQEVMVTYKGKSNKRINNDNFVKANSLKYYLES